MGLFFYRNLNSIFVVYCFNNNALIRHQGVKNILTYRKDGYPASAIISGVKLTAREAMEIVKERRRQADGMATD